MPVCRVRALRLCARGRVLHSSSEELYAEDAIQLALGFPRHPLPGNPLPRARGEGGGWVLT